MINVLPEQEKKDVKKEYRIRLLIAYLFLLSFLVFTSVFLLIPTYVVSKTKETSLEQKLSAFNNANAIINENDLAKISNEINNTLLLLSTNKPINTNIVEDIIMPIINARPSVIYITQIFYLVRADGFAGVEIRGTSATRTALQSFKSALSTNQKIDSVDLPISNFVKKSDIPFIINIKLK